MDTQKTPRFSHITVGKTVTDELIKAEEEEEVTIIGAVGLPTKNTDTEKPAARDSSHVQKADTDDVKPSGKKAGSTARSEKPDEEEDLDIQMPFVQKIVIIVCGIAFIVVIAYLIWHWMS